MKYRLIFTFIIFNFVILADLPSIEYDKTYKIEANVIGQSDKIKDKDRDTPIHAGEVKRIRPENKQSPIKTTPQNVDQKKRPAGQEVKPAPIKTPPNVDQKNRPSSQEVKPAPNIRKEVNRIPSGNGDEGKRDGKGHTFQRSPSMSRTSRSSTNQHKPDAAIPKADTSIPKADTSKPEIRSSRSPRVGGQSGTRNRIQQFIKNKQNSFDKSSSSQSPERRIENRDKWKSKRKYSNNLGRDIRNKVHEYYPNRNYWFNRQFFDSHHYHPAYYNSNTNWWIPANAIRLGSWLGWQNQPYYYDYDDRYGYFEPVEIDQSQINQHPQENIADSDWMALGVFSISKEKESLTTPTMFVQLALNKNGNVAGTLFNPATNEAYELVGEVDPESQLAIWQIADNEDSPVMETGVYNLTLDEAEIKVYFSNGLTEKRFLIRINSPSESWDKKF